MFLVWKYSVSNWCTEFVNYNDKLNAVRHPFSQNQLWAIIILFSLSPYFLSINLSFKCITDMHTDARIGVHFIFPSIVLML